MCIYNLLTKFNRNLDFAKLWAYISPGRYTIDMVLTIFIKLHLKVSRGISTTFSSTPCVHGVHNILAYNNII